jgi:hypothetical protein
MSLLGINIDPAHTKERLESPLGFVEETNDEALLKQLGAIVLEKGTWTPKYKGQEVAELLNWIATGKPTGGLPTLAKRLLCLKREKLDRSKKDARSASYARASADKWIKEIDAIFSQEKEPVECIVDIIEEPCNSKNNIVNGPDNTDKKSAPPSLPAPKGDNSSGQKPSAPGAPGANKPATGQGVKPTSPDGSETTVTETKNTPAERLSNTTGPTGIPPLVEVEKKAGEQNPILPILQFVAGYYKTSGDDDLKIRIEKLIALLFILSLRDPINKEQEAAVQKGWDTGAGEEDKLRIDKLLNALEIEEPKPTPSSPAAEAAVETRIAAAVAEEVKKMVVPRRYTCSDKVSCLQQLVYTTCGEASLLDPLIDHLNKLLATIGSLSIKSSASDSNTEQLTELKSLIEAKAGELTTSLRANANQESLKSMLLQFESELVALDSTNKKGETKELRTKLNTQIARIKDQLAAENPLGEKDQFIAQLEEESRLLTTLITTIDDSAENKIYSDFKEQINGQLMVLRGAGGNIRKEMGQMCNVRAFEYRKALEAAKAEESASSAAAIAATKKECEEKLTSLRTEHETAIAATETEYKTEITRLTLLVERLTKEKQACDSQISSLQTQLTSAQTTITDTRAAANASRTDSTTKDAKIKSLEAELSALRTECDGLRIKADSANAKNRNIGSLRSQLDAATSTAEAEAQRYKGVIASLTPPTPPPPPPAEIPTAAPPPPPAEAPPKPAGTRANREAEAEAEKRRITTGARLAKAAAAVAMRTAKGEPEKIKALISEYESQMRYERRGPSKKWDEMTAAEKEGLIGGPLNSLSIAERQKWEKGIKLLQDERAKKRGGTRKNKTFGRQTRKLHK